MFLDDEELFQLTGRRQKARQIEQLRRMGIPFWINAGGRPVVTRAALEGKKDAAKPEPKWEPKWGASLR